MWATTEKPIFNRLVVPQVVFSLCENLDVKENY